MFGFFSKKDETEKLLHGRDPQAENIPIHTMERDLESADQPEKIQTDESLKISPPTAPRIDVNSLTDQQKTSPFLSKKVLAETSVPAYSKPTVAVPVRTATEPQSRPFAPPGPQSAATPSPGPAAFSVPQPKTASRPVPEPAPRSISDKPLPKELFVTAKGAVTDSGKDAEPGDRKNLKKLILILIVVLIITIASAGGYYFWSTRKNTQVPEPVAQGVPAEETDENAIEEEVTENEEIVTPKFSTGGPNYLEYDPSSPLPDALKETLKSYVQEVQASGISGAVEFKVVTLEKSPVSLPMFLEKMKITFSPELASSLEDNYSLYVYNDQGSPGVGLSINAKKQASLEDVMVKEEANLPQELEPIFPFTQFTLEKNKSFSTAEYDSSLWGKIGVRYLNIISPENLSVDYALINTGTTKLIIGTTKATLRTTIESQKADIPTP